MSLHIVLTGCTRGCGRALLDRFHELGHRVSGCGANPDRAAELSRTLDPRHDVRAVDIARDDAVRDWAAAVLDARGAPDLIVNNAAIINANGALWEVPPAEFQAVMDVNVVGTVNVIRHFLPPMIARGQGVVVNFSSTWGRTTSPEVAPYCASKWAIEGLTRGLADDLPPGMAAVALNPGIIDTEMLRSCFGEGASAYPDPGTWSKEAARRILSFGPAQNGQSLDVA